MFKFSNKLSSKMIYVLAGIVAGATITLVTTTNAAQISRQNAVNEESSKITSSAASSEVVSSETEISSAISSAAVSSAIESSEPESKTEIESETDAGVSKIHEETNKGVSTIQEETQKAVQEVQKAVPEVTSSESGPKITYERNKITGEKEYHQQDRKWSIDFIGCLQEIDEANKCLIISYGGNYPGNIEDWDFLSGEGFSVKNAEGTEMTTQPNGFCSFKVPYENLSDVSELYFCYGNQSIKITVS